MKRDRAQDHPIELPVADADTASLFLALDTQWRRHAMSGQRVGIDYTAIGPTAQMLGITMSPELLADIRTMEAAAMKEMAR